MTRLRIRKMLDALPGEELRGRVARIELKSEDYRGDVTYPSDT